MALSDGYSLISGRNKVVITQTYKLEVNTLSLPSQRFKEKGKRELVGKQAVN